MKSGIALDIDETLSWTIGRWFADMQKIFGNPENLSVHDMIAKYRYSQNVPYYQTKEANAWMEEKRSSNEFQTTMGLMPGAKEGVKILHKIIPITAYITIRPEKVLEGTHIWLKENGFPDAEIIARPNELPHTDGNQWKAGRLLALYPHVLGIIDDNVGLLKYLPNDYKGHIFLFTHTEVPEGSPANTYACPDWESVVKKAKEVFN